MTLLMSSLQRRSVTLWKSSRAKGSNRHTRNFRSTLKPSRLWLICTEEILEAAIVGQRFRILIKRTECKYGTISNHDVRQ